MQIYGFLKQFFGGDGKGGGFKLTNNYLDAGLSPFLSFRFKFLAVNLGLGYSRDCKLYSRLTAVLNIIHLYPPVSRYIPQLVVYLYPPISRYIPQIVVYLYPPVSKTRCRVRLGLISMFCLRVGTLLHGYLMRRNPKL